MFCAGFVSIPTSNRPTFQHSGTFTIHKRDGSKVDSRASEGAAATPKRRRSSIGFQVKLGKEVAEVARGAYFGELALLYGAPRSASVR